MKKILAIVLALTLIFALAGCAKPAEQAVPQAAQQEKAAAEPQSTKIEITDIKGRKVTLEKLPQKIVSLSPSNTEIVYALGAGDKLVGVTSFCDYPEQAKSVEKVGTFEGPNIELIKKVQPDVVLAGGYMQEDLIKGLEGLNIPVVSTEALDFNGIYDSIKLIGQVTGTEGKADEIVAGMQKSISDIQEKTKDKPKKKVFYVVWTDPLTTAGAQTFINDVIKAAGGENVAEKVQNWAKYSPEELVKDNPEVLLSSKMASAEGVTIDTYTKGAVFKNLDAVKKGNVYIMSDDNIISRMGPRIVQAIEEVAKVLHGEI